MFTKTKMVLSVALVLGAGSAALANDQGEERGGFVIAGSADGVNPVYHRDTLGNGGTAYGYAVSPKQTYSTKHQRIIVRQ
jgi:hypothetical protein